MTTHRMERTAIAGDETITTVIEIQDAQETSAELLPLLCMDYATGRVSVVPDAKTQEWIERVNKAEKHVDNLRAFLQHTAFLLTGDSSKTSGQEFEAAIRRLEADKARLDWLDEQPLAVWTNLALHGCPRRVWIDAEMQAQK